MRKSDRKSTPVKLTDHVGFHPGSQFKNGKDLPKEDIAFLFVGMTRVMGFRPSEDSDQFLADSLRVGSNYDSTAEQWETARNMNGPYLRGDVIYVYAATKLCRESVPQDMWQRVLAFLPKFKPTKHFISDSSQYEAIKYADIYRSAVVWK